MNETKVPVWHVVIMFLVASVVLGFTFFYMIPQDIATTQLAMEKAQESVSGLEFFSYVMMTMIASNILIWLRLNGYLDWLFD